MPTLSSKMSMPPRKKLQGEGPLYDRKRTVFVGNLPFDVKVSNAFVSRWLLKK